MTWRLNWLAARLLGLALTAAACSVEPDTLQAVDADRPSSGSEVADAAASAIASPDQASSDETHADRQDSDSGESESGEQNTAAPSTSVPSSQSTAEDETTPDDQTTTEGPTTPDDHSTAEDETTPDDAPVAPALGTACADKPARWPADARPASSPAAARWTGPAVFDLERAVSGTTRAVELVAPPGTDRLFVVGRDGVIHETRDGVLVEPAYLDISEEVLSQADAVDDDAAPPPGAGVERLASEQGLLSMAFHPDHEVNGLLYTFHTRFGDGHSVVTEWQAPNGGPVAKDSARTVIVFEQDPSDPVHKGGQLRFGPDGLLYAGVGDGGASGDSFCHGRNPHTPLGAIVRIDTEPSSGAAYGIPTDNPYASGVSGHPAVWATGLRNPWRFTIDAGLIIVGDVGWNDREEVNVARLGADAGIDFGWSVFEGEVCIRADRCDEAAAPPAVFYSHDEGIAVIGGHVYRGSAIPELTGRYLYADFTGGWLRSITFDTDGEVIDHTDWTVQLSDPSILQGVYGFGVDDDGELYVIMGWGRRAYKLVPAN